MSFLRFFETVGNGIVQSIAQKQAMQGDGSKRRTAKRGQECTPCAAMGEVDKARKQFGFSVK